MSERVSERDIRIQKAENLRKLGINPYAQTWDKTNTIGDLTDNGELRTIEDIMINPHKDISIAGRLTLYRSHGKLSFGRLMDESGEIQIMRHRDNCNLSGKHGAENIKAIIGDYEQYLEQQDLFLQENGLRSLLQLDHIAFRAESIEQYEDLKNQFQQYGVLISESIFRERNISVIQLFTPLTYKEQTISVIELRAPLGDNVAGFDHAEYITSENLNDFMSRSNFNRDTSKLTNPANPSIKVTHPSGTIKIHTQPLLEIVAEQNKNKEFASQIVQKQDYISPYKLVEKMLDVGDIIGVKGELFVTHKGELTVFVSEYQLLTKAIRPLGDKFHGIGEDNQETAYRQRYLDMIFNRDSLERVKLRSKFTQVIRQFYRSQGFMEVETPVLGHSASGAAAAPFATHHNDFDIDMYLRISPETNLKKATVGMLEKIFEVAKDFRNEGSDPSHHQEFTMIEHYATYWSHEDNMRFTEEMFDYIFAHIPELSKTINVVDKQGVNRQVSFETPWQRIDYVGQIQKDSGINVANYQEGDDEVLRSDIKAAGHTWEGIDQQGLATMIDYLYKKVTRPKITGPAFIVNYPKLMQPLARQSDSNPSIVEQRQLLINGREVIKAYSELVDPIQQQANFDAQAGAVAAGDDEATKGDDEFVLAMEYGMPPQSGRGMGIDRIFAMLTEQANVRDVIMFPMMKPEN